MVRLRILTFPLLLMGALAPGVAAAAEAGVELDPARLVEAADRVRFPAEGFQVDVSVVSTSPNRDPDLHEYRVLSRNSENTILLTTAPAAEKGNMMLVRGSDLWAFLPNVSQPVRLPFSARLTGQVANGDLARANFAGDYTAELVGSEVIDGAPHHVLELTAAKKFVTYHQVRYWVRAKDARPYKAEFFSKSKRHLKTCLYQEYGPLGGAVRPTRLVMTDALKPADRSVLEFRDMVLRDLPDQVFTKDYLKKLQ